MTPVFYVLFYCSAIVAGAIAGLLIGLLITKTARRARIARADRRSEMRARQWEANRLNQQIENTRAQREKAQAARLARGDVDSFLRYELVYSRRDAESTQMDN